MISTEAQPKQDEKILPQQTEAAAIPAQPEVAAQVTEAAETDKEINWRKFREQRELDRKAREEAQKLAAEERAKAEALTAAMNSLLNKQQNHQQIESHQEESEEQRIARQVEAILSQREAQSRKELQEREQREFPERLQSSYPDFHQVCKSTNVDYLEFHYPEVATPFRHMPDGYEKWQAIYKAIKRFVPNLDAQKDIQKASLNSQKPQSLSSTGTAQGGNAMPAARLDEQRKADNWARMQKVLKGIS